MATVDLNYVQFWQPPSKPSLYKQHTFPRKHSRAASATRSRNQPVATTRQRGRDFEAQPEDEEGDAQELASRIHDLTNSDEDADDSLPSIEEILGPLLRKKIATEGCQGTRDRPVILEDDEHDTPDPTAGPEANSTSANAGPVPASELSQCSDPSDREAWWDVEEGCVVYEDLHPPPPLDHEGLASTPAQDQPPSQDLTKPLGDNRTTRSASEDSAPQSLTTLDEDGGGESAENVSDLESDMLLALKGREELPATSPCSARPRRSANSPHPPIDHDCEQDWSEELRSSSRLCSQVEEKKGLGEQGQEEIAVDEIRQEAVDYETGEADDGDDIGEREQLEEKRRHQNEGINSCIHHCESSGHGRDTDEEDENPRPMKHRRLLLASSDMARTPPLAQSSPKPCLAPPHSAMSSSITQLEVGDGQFQDDLAHPPTSVNNDDHDDHEAHPSYRCPSATEESAPVAEYHEWPFRGFLKCVTIGNQITYNLEFSLSHVIEHLNLSLRSGVSSTSSRESSVEAAVSRRAGISRKPRSGLTKKEESLLARMVHEDKTWAAIGQHFPGHTMQSLKENFKKQGGKPRKRGRKPGVKAGGSSGVGREHLM